MASLISITIADKDVGEVYYKIKTVLYLTLIKVGSNRDDYYTIECHLKIN